MSQSRIITISSVIVGTTVIASTLYAQSLQITSTIENATIMVRNIFLSPSGRDTGNASIKLEGDQGNVSIGGDLILRDDRYSCSDSDGTGCVLAVKQDGLTDLTEVALPQNTTVIEDDVTITGDSFFAKKGGSTDHLNRSANEIVFADPDIVPNAADAHLRVNVKDVVRATTTGTPKMVDVNGAINSRTSLEVSSPLDTTQKSNYNLTNTARTDFVLTKGDTTANEQSVRMKVGYHNGSQYTRQDMIIDSLGDTGARLGINTASYPEYTLDVNGETLSQETLTVGYLNSGNIVTNIRQAVGIVLSNPSLSAQTAIRSQSCDRAPIPSTLQCSNGNCNTISLSGSEISSYTCYDWVGTNTTMQRAQMYQIMSLYSSVTLIADTNTQSVGINTLRPQSTLDVNGESYLDGSGYIVGTPNNIASITNGNTSIQVKELNNTESTPYTGGNTNCKGLSVDEAGHIILVQLPTTMCGATGSIITPPTPTVINGACGSSHNTTGTSAPTSNLCSTGTASSVAGSGPWTWSCAGSNGGSTASCQMNKEIETNTSDLCVNIIGNQEEVPSNYNIGFNNYCMPSLNSGTITNTYFDRTNLYRAGMGIGDGNAGESCREYLSRIGNMPLNSNLKTIYIDENGNSQEHLGKCVYEKPSGTSLGWQNNCKIGNPDDRFGGWNPSVYCSDTYQVLQGGSTIVGDPNRQKTYRMKEYAPFTQTQSKSWNTTSNILTLFNTNPNQPSSGTIGQHCLDFIRGIGHNVDENEVDVNSLLGNQGQGSCLYAKGVTTVSVENYQFLGTIYTFNTTECKVVSSYDPAPGDNFYPTNYCNGYDQRAYKYR